MRRLCDGRDEVVIYDRMHAWIYGGKKIKGSYPLYKFLSRTVGPLVAQWSNLRILMYHRVQSHPRGQAYLPPMGGIVR